MAPRFLVRAPDHLGDGVMALPAIARLAEAGPVTVAAPGWGAELYGHLGVQVVGRDRVPELAAGADVAVLLKPSFSAAWQARRARRRVGLPTDHRRLLLTDVVPPRDEHRADSLLRVACAALGQEPAGPALPRFEVRDAAAQPGELPEDYVLVLPGTASAVTVAWRGFAALVAALGDRAVVTGGPGDEDAIAAATSAAATSATATSATATTAATTSAAAGARSLAPPSLAGLAALAARAVAVVGNDSGLPHLAAAAIRGSGGDPRRVHVVYASTDPERTGPPGTTAWPGPRPPCWPCYAKSCHVGGAPCRDAPVGPLLAALSGGAP